MRVLYILSLLGFMALNTSAQPSQTWCADNDWGNRYEGVKVNNSSTQNMELISLVAYSSAKMPNSDRSLNISFFSPEGRDYLLSVKELQPGTGYWLQDKNHYAHEGWNSFGPWPLSDVVTSNNLETESLGYMVRLEKDYNSVYVTPAYVYAGSEPDYPTSYLAYVKLGVSITGGVYQIHRGVPTRSAGQLLEEGRIGPKSANSYFPILIPLERLALSGWYTARLECRLEDNMESIYYTFVFYHRVP